MLQQNRFCGILLKKPALEAQLPSDFQKKGEHYFTKSDHENHMDGFKYDAGGAWSSALVKDGSIDLERDRVGVRTIYYSNTSDYFVYANTLNLLKQVPFIDFEPDPQAVLNFFLSGKTVGLLKHIEELDPGSKLSYSLAKDEVEISKAKVSSIKQAAEEEDQLIIQQRNHILDAVKAVGQSTKNLGTFLSGGIDSSVIAAAVKVLDLDAQALTAMTGNAEFDETSYAQDVVSKLGWSEWNQVMAGNIDLELENLHKAMELPTTSMGSFMQYELFRFCKHKGINHVLDGTGADALYAGHNYHKAIYWNELLKSRSLSSFRQEIAHPPTEMGALKYYMKNMMIYYYVPRFRPGSKLRFHLRNNELLQGLKSDLIYDNQTLLEVKPSVDLTDLNTFLRQQFYNGPVTELLRFTDRIGKYFGVMSHPIFCQHPALYESATEISSKFKIQKGVSKSILRKTFSTILPESVIYRKDKKGLVSPNNDWMRQHKDLLLSYLTEDLQPYFELDKMRSLLLGAIDHSGDVENYKVFRFLSFAIWYKTMVK